MTTLTVGTNTYVTLEQANTYMNAHPDSNTWTALSSDARCRFLLTAFRQLEHHPWAGTPSGDVAFPRSPFGDTVPQAIRDAQVEYANALHQVPELASLTSNERRVTMPGGISVEYFQRATTAPAQPLVFQQLIAPFLSEEPSVVSRGTSGESVTNEDNEVQNYGYY